MTPVLRDFAARASAATAQLYLLTPENLDRWRRKQNRTVTTWLKASGFAAKPGEISLMANDAGALRQVFAGVSAHNLLWDAAGLRARLPAGRYALAAPPATNDATRIALGWALGGYRFARYKNKAKTAGAPVLVWPAGADRAAVMAAARAIFLTRDLINTPAADLGPAELATAARSLARAHKATCRVITGAALAKNNYPLIHTVGRASARPPRLIDLRWGPARAPRLTLVGKGVVFDTGGLDLKPSASMLGMKKDMGGAAHVLGLAQMIMTAGWRLRLRVLIPAVENAVAGNAYRPSDVLASRQGLSVEVGNTDAEGRLVLADALAEAAREKPDMVVDFATLTGAQRVACGPDLPSYFTDDEAFSQALMTAAADTGDPLWRLPLHRPYRPLLDSKIADIHSTGKAGPGAILAALFLDSFIEGAKSWTHIDLMAWNTTDRPGRPQGGEAQGLRAVFEALRGRFG